LKLKFRYLAIIVILVIAAIAKSAGLLTDWLWFQSLGYQNVFLTILLSEGGIRILAGLLAFFFIFINLQFVKRPLLDAAYTYTADNVISIDDEFPYRKYLNPKFLNLVFIIASLLLGLFFAASVKDSWVLLQQFLHPTAFGSTDPIFQKDIGFYVFQLPFWQFIYRILSSVIVLTMLLVGIVYFLSNSSIPGAFFAKLLGPKTSRYHLSILISLYFLVKAWGYRMDQYMLLYSPEGAVFGAGYTDVHALLLALKVLVILSVITAIAVFISALRNRYRMVLFSIGFLIAASLLLGGIYPAVVQKFIVEPNELAKEIPYIEHNIKLTREAYDLEKIDRKLFPAGKTLNARDILANQDTIQNIRLWDWKPLQETYSQVQEMRPYYELKKVDIDRYIINNEIRQVMLAARELDQSKLSQTAQTWVNQRLKYTHGYGVVMSPVNEVAPEGLPKFFLKDIPPQSFVEGVNVDRPEIYFGEMTDNYVIVNTKTKEFDYPQGENNVMGTYKGNGGVKLTSLAHRALFALSFGDYRMLLSSNITNDSKMLYYRNIRERVPKIAPFLAFDSDPYLVVSNGKLYWIWDAYTTTNMYPYSEPFNRRDNYIRNSVKVVVDAYNGKVNFYISDADDPVIQTYAKIFPGMFQLLENMPGEEKPEFVLIRPFTPQNKKNMIAWLAARSDGENYGKMLVYEFPKQEVVYGPMQIEARISQDSEIAPQITLWDQRGSNVLRGNLLVIPIKDSILYVEPLFLQAEQSRLPELRRVIVTHGDKIVMEPTLDMALQKLFGSYTGSLTPDSQEVIQGAGEREDISGQEDIPNGIGYKNGVNASTDIKQLIDKAYTLYNRAEEKLKKGDWAGYGETWGELKDTLRDLKMKMEHKE